MRQLSDDETTTTSHTTGDLAVRRAVRTFIVDTFLLGTDDTMLTNSASLLETGIVDSFGILDLVSFVQDTYAITIADSEMLPENLDSLDAISAFVTRKLS